MGESVMGRAKEFIKSGIMMSAVGLAMRTAAMLFGAFVSRTVGAEGTGLYTLVMTAYSFAITFATSGISLTVTRLVASAIGEGRESRVGGILKSAFLYTLVFGAAATVGLFLGANFIGDKILGDYRTAASLRILAFSLIPASLSSVLSGYFVGVKRVIFNASATVFCQVVKMGVTVWLLFRFAPYGVVSAVMGLCLGLTFTEIFGCVLIFLEFLFDRRDRLTCYNTDKGEMSRVVEMAAPLALSAYVRSILLNVEHILIPKKLRQGGESRAEAYSHYGTLHGMALPLVTYPMSPLSSFAGLLVPEFAEASAAGHKDRMGSIAARALNLTLAYAAACAVYLYSFSAELGYLIYKSYEAGYYIAVLAPVIPIMFLDHVTDSMLKGIGEQVFSMWVNISDSLLSVILVCLLIPKMGIMGYAVVIVIMEGYNFILSFIRLGRRVRFKIDLRPSLLCLAASIISIILSDRLFRYSGASVSPVWIVLKMIFALSLGLAFLSFTQIFQKKAISVPST
jgi:stage V sporulation protein B